MQSHAFPASSKPSTSFKPLPPLPPRQLRATSAMSSAEKRIREMTRPSAAAIVVTMIAGIVAGAITGLMAGPIGFAFGAIVGASIGVAAGLTIQFMDAILRRHDTRLDREIGVDGGDLGAGPALEHERELFR